MPAIRRNPGADIVAAGKRHALDMVPVNPHAVYLGRTAAVARKINKLPVRRKLRFRIDTAGSRQPAQAPAIRTNQINLAGAELLPL